MNYLLVYSDKKLAFQNTACHYCEQPIPIEKTRKEFLWDAQRFLHLQNDVQIKDGTLDNSDFPIITLIFEDFDYNDEFGYHDALLDNLFQIARISMGNYTNLGHIKVMETTFHWLNQIRSLLSKYFSEQNYYYKIVNDENEDLLGLIELPITEE